MTRSCSALTQQLISICARSAYRGNKNVIGQFHGFLRDSSNHEFSAAIMFDAAMYKNHTDRKRKKEGEKERERESEMYYRQT